MLRKIIASQFKKPSGLFGIFSSNVMIKGNINKYDKLINDLDLQPDDKLLEIGYGPGVGINKIAKKGTLCTVHGIDFSPLMYKIATKYNKQFIDKGTMQVQNGDFLKTSVLGTDYDKIFCINVVYFWNELKEPFEKIFSLLKNGGTFYIYMAGRDALIKMKAPDSVFNKYGIDQMVEALTLSGFTSIKHAFDKGYYINARK